MYKDFSRTLQEPNKVLIVARFYIKLLILKIVCNIVNHSQIIKSYNNWRITEKFVCTSTKQTI